MLQTSKARFIEKVQLTPNIYQFEFEMIDPAEINFEAGQYIAIVIDKKNRRQYSVSTAPEYSKTRFQTVVDTRPNGVGTQHLMGLETSDSISFVGPIGNFVLPEVLSRNLFFIATGSGVAPLKSMMDSLIVRNLEKVHNLFIYFGTRSIRDVFFQNVFEQYVREDKVRDYRIYLSRETYENGHGKGYVTRFIDLHPVGKLKNSQFFLCGSGEMIKSVEAELKNKGVSKEQIFYEKFY